jgi:hypothetical protein
MHRSGVEITFGPGISTSLFSLTIYITLTGLRRSSCLRHMYALTQMASHLNSLLVKFTGILPARPVLDRHTLIGELNLSHCSR